MAGNFTLPPMGFGPGSQPTEDEGGALDYMAMPQDMRTFTPHVPDIAASPALAPALTLLAEIAAAADAASQGDANRLFDLSKLDADNRALIAETMGEGEVSIRVHGVPAIAIQESVFAGVWSLRSAERDLIEVGAIPAAVRNSAFLPRAAAAGVHLATGPGVVNAPPIMVELADKSAGYAAGDAVHCVNLTLLPHTEQDLAWLEDALGTGSVEILSRGYGNCRVTATATPHVWRVQFFNSMDTSILDTYEVTAVPEVVLAATEDLADSAERILEVLEAIG
ncbi:MAG: hydrogenase expression/formation protein [Maritimibacter sp.]|nr:hydrogenase expression/formation protein [Maritimibacter sp.]